MNLKGLKRFPRRVARRIVGPRTPIDRRLFYSFLPSSCLILFRLFSLFSPVSAVTYCKLLRELCRLAQKRLSLSARKILGNMKNGANDHRARNTSRLVSFRRDTCYWNRVVCRVIITFTTRTGCRETADDITDNVTGTTLLRGLGKAFHKISRVICFKRKVCSIRHSMPHDI